MKKVFALVLAISMLVMLVFSASAAGISTEESKIITALSKDVKMASGATFSLPDKFINQAEDYLTKADLTADQVSTIVTAVNKAAEALAKSTVKDLSKTDVAIKNEVLDQANVAANVIGAEARVVDGSATFNVKLVFVNSSVAGYTTNTEITVSLANDEIVQTGAEGNAMMAVVASVVVLAGVAFVVIASRKKAF